VSSSVRAVGFECRRRDTFLCFNNIVVESESSDQRIDACNGLRVNWIISETLNRFSVTLHKCYQAQSLPRYARIAIVTWTITRDLCVFKWTFGSQSTTWHHRESYVVRSWGVSFQSAYRESGTVCTKIVHTSVCLGGVAHDNGITFEPVVQICQAKYCRSAKGLAWSLNAAVTTQVVDLSLSSRGMQYHHLSRDFMATVYDLTRIEGHFLTCWSCFSFLATF